ncbi:UDP-glucose flavonoid 3-O-glucosyltransferase 7-like [Sorghum bicolor]|uniref:UDP-glucose flavonoid 3-O-glucosyltransferase 7-like n=1 Tax=Sorghum bicolor TaxID=4558 RepID=UPI000B425624|nr:UDP-glucose flavonoid 3-O-glucosyltransferase 7-like [Sorghum bicolor]|eukprot:XP_021309413.1 UDP-glucose flavonoid 3-O-glucosyltransferase 7-like [Sorghum bicolor]
MSNLGPQLQNQAIPSSTPSLTFVCHVARLFASRDADATLVLTRANAARLGGPVAGTAATGFRVRIITLTFPQRPLGLQVATRAPTAFPTGPFAIVVDLLAPLFADLLRRQPANAVVFDSILPWAATAASELGIRRYAFIGTGSFALSVQRAQLLHNPQNGVASDTESFLVPGLPNAVRLTRLRLAEAMLPRRTRVNS